MIFQLIPSCLAGFFGGLAGSKGGKKGKKGRVAEKGTAKPIDQRLTHSLDMINAFASLKVRLSVYSLQLWLMLVAFACKSM